MRPNFGKANFACIEHRVSCCCASLAFLVLFETALFLSLLVEPAMAQDPSAESAESRLLELESVLDYVELSLDHSVFQPQALAERLGPDPDMIARFMQTQIALRPYWGILRGARGVLIDRLGNSLDRSVLATELLKLTGFETRLGHFILSDAAIDTLSELANSPVVDPPETFKLTPEMLSVFMTQGHLSSDEIRTIYKEAESDGDKGAADVLADLRAFTENVDAIVSDHDFDPPPNPTRSQLAEFFWPEYRDGDGQWKPLDILPVSFNRLVPPGSRYIVYSDLDSLPEGAFHRFSLKANLIVEASSGVKRVLLAETTMTSLEAIVEPLSISNAPLVNKSAPAEETSKKQLSDNSVFIFSMFRGQSVFTTNYDAAGRLIDPSSNANKPSLEGASRRLRDIFNLDSEKDAPAAPAGRVAGLELTYLVSNSHGLNAQPDIREFVRSTVSSDQTTDFSLLSPWIARISLAAFRPPPQYWIYRTLLSSTAAIRTSFRALRTGVANAETSFDLLGHHTWPGTSVGMIAEDLNRQFMSADPTYVDRLAVVVEEATIVLGDGIELSATGSLDLVQIAERQLGRASSLPGLQWTLAEDQQLRLSGGQSLDGFAKRVLLQEAGSQIHSRRLKSAADVDASDLPDLVKRQLHQEIKNSSDVVLFDQDSTTSWLSRDRASGLWIGRAENGRGDTSVEYTFLQRVELGSIAFEMGGCLWGANKPNNMGKGGIDHSPTRYQDVIWCFQVAGLSWFSMHVPALAIGFPFLSLFQCLGRDPNSSNYCLANFVTGFTSGIGSVPGVNAKNKAFSAIMGILARSAVSADQFLTSPQK